MADQIAGVDYDPVKTRMAGLIRKSVPRMERVIRKLAMKDPLTDLPNRRFFEQELSMLKFDDKYAIAMIDADFFKNVNDLHGHKNGDRVLQHIALMLRTHFREEDVVARLGGEEFVILFKDVDETERQVIIERLELLRRNIEGIPTVGHRKKEKHQLIPVTISAGVAYNDGNSDGDELLRRADIALYQAKSEGRNRVVSWSEGMVMNK